MQEWHWWAGVLGGVFLSIVAAVVWAGTLLTKIVTMLTKLETHAEATKGHGKQLADHETRITVLERADKSGGWPSYTRRNDAE